MGQLIDKTVLRKELSKLPSEMGFVRKSDVMQMFGNKNAYQNFLKIKDSINVSGVMFLPDGEYHHYYFTTNNKLYPYFFGYTENDRKVWMKKYEEIEQYCG